MQNKFTGKVVISFAIVIVLIVLAQELNVYNVIRKQIYRQQYSEYVNKYAEMNDIDPLWIYAIIKVESNFDSKAISGRGAKGLMQLMDTTAKDLAEELKIEDFESTMLYNPEVNIMLGTAYFNKLVEKYDGNYYLAIAAYNGGIGNVDNWIANGIIKADASDIEKIPYNETNLYVRKAINAYTTYVELYNV